MEVKKFGLIVKHGTHKYIYHMTFEERSEAELYAKHLQHQEDLRYLRGAPPEILVIEVLSSYKKDRK